MLNVLARRRFPTTGSILRQVQVPLNGFEAKLIREISRNTLKLLF